MFASIVQMELIIVTIIVVSANVHQSIHVRKFELKGNGKVSRSYLLHI